MLKTCDLVLKQCLPCNDDPIANISAEAPDVDVFVGFRDFKWNPPLGVTYFQLGCKTVCFSTVSQDDADLCAQRQAQACVWNGGSPPITPPIPPGPNSPGGRGPTPNTPGGVPPSNPRNKLPTFGNHLQTCTEDCPDGLPFTESVDPGTITALSQALADEQAQSMACNRALSNRICFSSSVLPSKCVNELYSFQLEADGGIAFTTHDYDWVIESGSLPPGLDLDPEIGLISGTAFSSGTFTFRVEVTDANGSSQSKLFSICIMEIVTAATLPEATQNVDYAQPLIEEPADVASEVWTLIGGSLPPGIALAANGALNGTPTDTGSFEFTVQVAATCDGSPVSCQKTFNLEVATGVDCMGNVDAVGDLVWNSIGPSGTLTIAGGDATFSAVGLGSIAVRGTTTICNPKTDPYNLTFQFNWSQNTDLIVSGQAVVNLNGVDHFGPVENTTGAKSFNLVLALPSGVNTLEVKVNGSGVFTPSWTGGVITIRPLTPP